MLSDLMDNALSWVESFGIWGPVVFIALYVVATVFMLPGSALTLGAGLLFGVVQGSILVSIASTLGASASFLVGRYLARNRISTLINKNPKFKAVDQAVESEGWKIVGLTRLSPVFPFTFLNYAYGLTGVRFWPYVIASWIGMIPGTIMYVYIGSLPRLGTEEQASGGTAERVLQVVGLLATVVVTVLITRIARKALQEKIDDN